MADPATLTPDGLEILLARDLRKAGLDIGRVRRERLQRADDGSDDYSIELTVELRATPPARLFAEGHRGPDPLDAAAVDRVSERIHGDVTGGLLLSTAGFEPGAVSAAAANAPVALLRVSDARAAYDSSGWGPPGQYPIWLPEHLLELAGRGPTGAPVYRILDEAIAADLLTALRLTDR